MIKKFLNKIFHFEISKYPPLFMNYHISAISNYCGINENIKRENPIVISLSSDLKNLKEHEVMLYSLLTQDLKPDKIVLWLDEELNDLSTLPYEISQYVKNGLEICFCKNLNSYTSTLLAFKKYSDSIIVTASEKKYYPQSWLKKLYLSYISNPQDIHLHLAKYVQIDKKFFDWSQVDTTVNAGFEIFPMLEGGVLYPPTCFSKEVFRNDVFLKYSKDTPELWIWIIALLNNCKFRVVKNRIKTFFDNDLLQIFKGNNLKNNDIDENLKNLMMFYGENIKAKLVKK